MLHSTQFIIFCTLLALVSKMGHVNSSKEACYSNEFKHQYLILDVTNQVNKIKNNAIELHLMLQKVSEVSRFVFYKSELQLPKLPDIVNYFSRGFNSIKPTCDNNNVSTLSLVLSFPLPTDDANAQLDLSKLSDTDVKCLVAIVLELDEKTFDKFDESSFLKLQTQVDAHLSRLHNIFPRVILTISYNPDGFKFKENFGRPFDLPHKRLMVDNDLICDYNFPETSEKFEMLLDSVASNAVKFVKNGLKDKIVHRVIVTQRFTDVNSDSEMDVTSWKIWKGYQKRFVKFLKSWAFYDEQRMVVADADIVWENRKLLDEDELEVWEKSETGNFEQNVVPYLDKGSLDCYNVDEFATREILDAVLTFCYVFMEYSNFVESCEIYKYPKIFPILKTNIQQINSTANSCPGNDPKHTKILFHFDCAFQFHEWPVLRSHLEHVINSGVILNPPQSQMMLQTIVLPATDIKRFPQLTSWSRNLNKIVSFACLTNLNLMNTSAVDIVMETIMSCKNILNSCSLIVWRIDLHIKMNGDSDPRKLYSYKKSVYEKLDVLSQARSLFLELHPEVEIILNFRQNPETKRELCGSEVYCEACSSETAFYDEILDSTRQRLFPVIFKSVLGYGYKAGWWSSIGPVGCARHSETDYPIFTMRQAPNDMKYWPTDSCIMKSRQVDQCELEFGNLAGITTTDDKPNGKLMTAKEFEVVVLFGLSKFSLLEIRFSSESDLMYHLISQNFVDLLAANGICQRHLFLQMSVSQADEFIRKFKPPAATSTTKSNCKGPAITITGIHVNSWNNPKSQALITQFVPLAKNHGIQIGLDQVEYNSKINAENNANFEQTLSLVNYVVHHCVTNYPSNAPIWDGWNSQFFNEHLYYVRLLARYSSNLTVYFRLSSNSFDGRKSGSRRDVENFLMFFNDVSQFAKGNKIKYFMFNVFDNPDTQENGWWTISNFDDLSNPHVFHDKKLDFLDKSEAMWKPHFPSKHTIEHDAYAPWLIPVVASLSFLVILSCIATVILAFIARQKSRYLSQQETDEFFNGRHSSLEGFENPGSTGECLSISMEFNTKFEVCKKQIEYDNLKVLGIGQYGTVYQGTVNGQKAAIKTPHEDGSKESFKSMLLEVKILCYIGQHPNVVNFLGCYVHEISAGILYIGMELCVNGSLLAYLRILHKNVGENYVNVNFHQMCKFAYEISLGMEYIMGKHVIHGDLSARNVLLNANFTCKIGDFGLSRKMYEYAEYIKKTQEPLPWRWLAYESLKRMEFTSCSDVWSFGVTAWEIFTLGDIPYPGMGYTPEFIQQLEQGLRLSFPQYGSYELYAILQKCWNIDPRSRPAFREIGQYFENMMGLKCNKY